MQEQIDNIMDNFDFSRVLKVMRALNWEWGSCGTEHEPDEAELRREAAKTDRDRMTAMFYGMTCRLERGRWVRS